MAQQRIDLLTMEPEALQAWAREQGMPPYRARQILRWVYDRGETSFARMTDLPRADHLRLEEAASLGIPEVLQRQRARDGTEKYLLGLVDGEAIECVLIPEKRRLTLCLSTQAGCARNCRYCLTARGGLRRNLEPHEIVGQLLAVRRGLSPGARITNLVLMGMGEPLDNFEAVVRALWRLTRLAGYAPHRITLSTAGVIPKIARLAREAPPVNLAVSLCATTDAVRSKLMPLNRRYPIRDLLAACRAYPLPPRRRITFEYVLLSGVNDTPEDARRLVRLLHGLRCKVNLIPFNPLPGAPPVPGFDRGLARPSPEAVDRFRRILIERGLVVFIRESRGREIAAACGQLHTSRTKT
ncbi:MAG: 23S rRNA (adenine(2503)-C(2))-methyltransferase RlmN [Nitrospirae bacterium]|nr:23S rRNA (adenine(2503)-C(2))-methyltransferase RlmN [Nitrospirota bacterium]